MGERPGPAAADGFSEDAGPDDGAVEFSFGEPLSVPDKADASAHENADDQAAQRQADHGAIPVPDQTPAQPRTTDAFADVRFNSDAKSSANKDADDKSYKASKSSSDEDADHHNSSFAGTEQDPDEDAKSSANQPRAQPGETNKGANADFTALAQPPHAPPARAPPSTRAQPARAPSDPGARADQGADAS